MRRGVAWNGCYGQPQPATNYHRTHSEHATMVAERPPPCHAGGGAAVQHHVVVHKESFEEEVDGGQQGRRHHHFDNYRHVKPPQTKPMAMAKHHVHGGGSHRYEAFQETFEEETTYSAGRHHGRRDEYQTYEETYEEEVVVGGGGGCAQLKRGCRGA